MQVPVVNRVRTPPWVIVHTPVVLEAKITVSPELAVAVSVGVVPKFWEPGLAKVMVWPATGVPEFEEPEAAPVPAEL